MALRLPPELQHYGFMRARWIFKSYSVNIMSFSVGLCGLDQKHRAAREDRWMEHKSHLSHAGVAVFLSTQLHPVLPKRGGFHPMGVCLLPKR